MDSSLIIIIVALAGLGATLFWYFKRRARTAEEVARVPDEAVTAAMSPEEVQREQWIRNQWLTSLFVSSTIAAVITTLTTFNGIPDAIELLGFLPAFILSAVLTALLTVLYFWVNYHCSYKKRGKVLLFFNSLTLPISALLFVFTDDFTSLPKWGISLFILTPIYLGSQFYFWINCIRLYRVNAHRWALHRKLLSDPIR